MADEALHEASTSVDLPMLRPILERMAGLVSGFSQGDADRITSQTEALEPDSGSVDESFRVTFRGDMTVMNVATRLDDTDSCVIEVFTSAALAQNITGIFQDVASESEPNSNLPPMTASELLELMAKRDKKVFE